jgi:predicted Zn-dependent protease
MSRGPLVLATVLALLAAACTPVVNPATGQTQYTSLSRDDEFGGAYHDPALQRYVDGIGRRLQAVSELPGDSFTFTVLDSDIVNAFALPGGFVYVSRGLLALANDEAELAGVIGHEIGHVTARHTAQRYDRAQQAQIGATVAQVLGSVLGGMLLGEGGAQLGGQVAGQAAAVGATAYVQGYSREQELEADELGVRYLARAGYDPQAMASFLGQLEASDRLQRQLDGRQGAEVPTWLASHPRTKDRIERAIAASGVQAAGGARDADPFLDAIDGIVFGDSPDQGFVDGARFVHPVLRFRFDAPAGFTLKNSSRNVTGGDGRGRAMVFDMAADGGAREPGAFLQNVWLPRQRLQQIERLTVAGRPAAIAPARVSFRNRPATALFGAIALDGGTMARFVYLREGSTSEADLRAFRASFQSYATLSAAEAAVYRPLRIRVVTVGPNDTVASLAARMDVDGAKREWFELLNGTAGRELRPGERVKLVVRG